MTKQYRVGRGVTTEVTTYVVAESKEEAEGIAMRLREEQFIPVVSSNHPDWYSRLGEGGDVNCVEKTS